MSLTVLGWSDGANVVVLSGLNYDIIEGNALAEQINSRIDWNQWQILDYWGVNSPVV